jgi:drug/metabolite transporter (DMT)-like permease
LDLQPLASRTRLFVASMDAGTNSPMKTPQGSSTDRRSILLLAFVIAAWGGNYVVMKLAVAVNGPWTFNAFRYGLAALFLGVGLGLRHGWRGMMPVRGERAAMALIGALQASVMTGCTTWALTVMDASRTVLIAYSMPIWALLFAFLISREAVTSRLVASVALGFGGLAILCAPWAMDWSSDGIITGSVVALIGSMAWALGAVLYRRRTWASSLSSQIFLQMSTAAVIALLCALLFEQRPLQFDLNYGLIVVYNALVPTILAFWCWAEILTRIPAATAGQFVLFSPVFGILVGHLVLREPLTLTLMLSAVLILCGALLAYIQPSAKTVR